MRFTDPDGRNAMDTMMQLGGTWQNVGYGYFNAELGKYIDYEGNEMNAAQVLESRAIINGGGGAGSGGNSGPSVWQSIGNFFSNLFGGNKGAGITTFAAGATITRIPPVQVGPLISEGVVAEIAASMEATVATIFSTAGMTAAAIFYPAMIKEPEFNWTRDLPKSIPITTTGDNPQQTITLYRGISSKAKGSMYFEAMQGIAIPNGFRQVAATWGPHSDMELHAGGDNLSIWTSWTSNINTARDFATGTALYKNGVPGIIMSKTFRTGQATPNPFNPAESEWLVPGITYGAKVKYVSP
ncbi:hypothetical protein K0U91_13100 [Chryseobacterium chendengshani]|uniref:hypothetical protein n=1 Tax=Chryseobacterium sp. LJ668 TaxID=2864040 RepID=UPI001C690D7A|nr:hypothetical protein [Chryseobacterium sp. LJ668]MBW8522443.1 hypothetical protein [Chryseobacterium sp. LJ668]QYK15986.1 hypothetical protein K0U91_13100 [Chryseobacterium sp. LJ668]